MSSVQQKTQDLMAIKIINVNKIALNFSLAQHSKEK